MNKMKSINNFIIEKLQKINSKNSKINKDNMDEVYLIYPHEPKFIKKFENNKELENNKIIFSNNTFGFILNKEDVKKYFTFDDAAIKYLICALDNTQKENYDSIEDLINEFDGKRGLGDIIHILDPLDAKEIANVFL